MKKLLAGCLSAVMMLSSLGVVAGAINVEYDDTYTIGDVDGNGSVNLKDSCLLKGCIVGDAKCLAAANTDAGDLVADGVINTRDSFQLKKLLLGMITADSLESDAQIYKLTIGGKDISEFTIYAPENPEENKDYNDSATYAATILQKYVRYATGIKLPIAKLGDTEPTGSAIVLHLVERHTEADGSNTELAEKLGTENYMYKVENGKLDIWGTYRGNLYAVYEILENYLGFRFADDQYVFEYKSRYVDIPEGTDVFFEPAMKYRYAGQNMGNNVEEYAMPARMNSTCYYAYDGIKHGGKVGPQFINAHSYGHYKEMYLGEADESLLETNPAKYYNDKYSDGAKKFEKTGHTGYNWQPCMSVMTFDEYGDTEEEYQYYLEEDCEFFEILEGMDLTIKRIMAWNNEAYRFKTDVKNYVLDGEKSISFSQNDNIMNCKCTYCSAKANGTFDWADAGVGDKFVGKAEGYPGIYIEAGNKAAEHLQKDFPGMRVHTIMYEHAIPYSIRPCEFLNVYFCMQGCNNHYLGTDDCGDCYGQVWQVAGKQKVNNKDTNKCLKAWGEMCDESGAQLWFWYYGVQYHTVIAPLPNILNFYYDLKFLYEECGCDGVYYEGGGNNYNFETLKAYIAGKMMWEPDMEFEQFVAYIKEYLYIHYGNGYEELYKFIEMQDIAGNKCGTCFISNYDTPGDCYSYKYIRDHYEEMRALLVTALEKAERDDQKKYTQTLIDCFDFLGLSCSYWKMYHGYGVESEAEKAELKALYEERYTNMYNNLMYNYPHTFEIEVNGEKEYIDVIRANFIGSSYGEWRSASLPETIKFDQCPAVQVYGSVNDKTGELEIPVWVHREEVADFFLKGIESDAVES